MRTIDAFNHFFPKRYYDALLETPAGAKDLGKRVRGIPALLLFKGGQLIDQVVGLQPKDEIKKVLDRHLSNLGA